MAKPLIDSKIFGFSGIQDNVKPLNDRNSVLSCLNMESHVKPGKLTLRPPYQKTYDAPVDPLGRINTQTFISFDNFYEQTAADGTEVTCLVTSGQIQAPAAPGGSALIDPYAFNAVQIWIRPFWNGTYWQDEWQWLNESTITKIAVAPDATYKNKMDIIGYYGNLAQYSIVNITKDSTLPAAILRSDQNGNNTTIYTSNFANDWELDDVVVLMRCYIPIKYMLRMFNVDKREISFHRLNSKIRIGFGGKYQRIALGVEYCNNEISMKGYSFTSVAPALVGTELTFKKSDRMIVQFYSLINESSKDFILDLSTDLTGDLPNNTYYIKAVAKLDGVNAIQVNISSMVIDAAGNGNVIATFYILAGSLSRRLTEIDLLYSDDGAAYYYWKTVRVTKVSSTEGGTMTLQDNGYFLLAESFTDINSESSAVSASDANSLGSWVPLKSVDEGTPDLAKISAVVGISDNFGIKIEPTATYGGMTFAIPLSALADPGMVQDVLNTIVIKAAATIATAMKLWIVAVNADSSYDYCGGGSSFINIPAGVGSVTTFTISYGAGSWDYSNLTSYLAAHPDAYGALAITFGGGTSYYVAATDYVQIDSISITPQASPGVEGTTVLGAQDLILYGYLPNFDIVRDWAAAAVINGKVYAGAGYVEKRYSQFVFFSPVGSDGSNMYDVLTSASFLDSDKDNYRGESIIGITILLNLQLLVMTEAGGVIINPETGQTQEVARGYGLMAKDTLMKFRDIVYWGSTEDIVKISATTGYNPEELSSGSVRGLYNALADKTMAVACIDAYGSYRMAFQATDPTKELLYTSRGWFDASRDHHPVVLRNGFLGIVWFADSSGNIYSIPPTQQDYITTDENWQGFTDESDQTIVSKI